MSTSVAVAIICSFFLFNNFIVHNPMLEKSQVSKIVGDFVLSNQFPTNMKIAWEGMSDLPVTVNYTLDEDLQEASQKLFKSYKPDYGAMVVMDATTGEILSMESFVKDSNQTKEGFGNLALRASFPAASVFKVITAAAVIDRHQVSPEMMIPYSGGSHTLYKRNVFDEKPNRWTRFISMKEAFARSINTVFAKLGIHYLEPQELADYARRFKFNEEIPSDIPVPISHLSVPQNIDWEMAEVASGFNKVSTMSPLQGALIAATVANDGVMMTPHLIKSIHKQNGEALYITQPQVDTVVMEPNSAEKLRILMSETVHSGTSRKMFRDLVRSRQYRDMEFGGKTGSLTGTNPAGKVDWFVGYARSGQRRLAVAAITIHKQFWTVKSAYLARKMIEAYFVSRDKVVSAR